MTDHFKGRQFNQSVITFAVGYYLRYNISYRDLVENDARPWYFRASHNPHALGTTLLTDYAGSMA